MTFTAEESQKIQAYLRNKFGNEAITLKARSKANDSVEVLLHGEFIGVIYKDTEDDDLSYNFSMAILDIDLEEMA